VKTRKILLLALLTIFITCISLWLLRTSFNTPTHILSATSAFFNNNIWKKDPEILLIATGDVIPARSVNAQATRKKDFIWTFENIKELLKQGDIALINLEAPLIQNCPVTDSGMIFCGSQEHIKGLLASGVDVVNLANNHIGNWGIDGVEQTKRLLEENGISICGLSEPTTYTTVKGIKFAFLGFNDIGTQVGTATAVNDDVTKFIKDAALNADVVVVSFHWGPEYTATPSERQKELAHLAIDSGAALVIGNHPHWVQPGEFYNGGYIKYAHGNTIFDQMWSEKTKEGVIGKYYFKGDKLDKMEFVKTKIKDYGQPEIIGGEEA